MTGATCATDFAAVESVTNAAYILGSGTGGMMPPCNIDGGLGGVCRQRLGGLLVFPRCTIPGA